MSSSSTPPKVIKALCSTCSLRELCLPVGLMQDEVNQLDAVIRQSRRLKKGEYLFRVAEPFKSLYAIRTGFFKTAVASQDGRDQVTGFFMLYLNYHLRVWRLPDGSVFYRGTAE